MSATEQCPDHRRPISPAQQAAHRQQHMRDPAALAPRPAGAQPPADPAPTPDDPVTGMPPPSQTPRTARAAQPPRRQPPLDHARNNAYRDHRCLRAPARPSRHLGQEKDGRAAANPNLITVASHTKKGNPAGLPFRPSSPQTTLARRYVLITKVAGQRRRPAIQHITSDPAHQAGH
jgi:hypothetical protein